MPRHSRAPAVESRRRRGNAVGLASWCASRRRRMTRPSGGRGAGDTWRDSGHVFTTPIGTPLDPANLRKAFKRLLVAAELPAVRFHDLRHSAASLLLAEGVPMRMIIETLGHSQISITSDLYSHVAPELRQDVADAADRALGGLG